MSTRKRSYLVPWLVVTILFLVWPLPAAADGSRGEAFALAHPRWWVGYPGLPVLQGRMAAANASPLPGPAAVLTVCPAGPPTCDFSSPQAAVDAAAPGDTIKVAEGTYADVHSRPAPPGYSGPEEISQVLYLTKTVTVRGGYTDAFTEPPDPVAHPTTLDAQGGGRVLLIAGAISPTVEGLRLTGGNAAGQGGHRGDMYYRDAGGGVCIITASGTLRDNWMEGNSSTDLGGGLYVAASTATLRGNTIAGNTATFGGGIRLHLDATVFLSNTIANNMALDGGGGGICAERSQATFQGNAVLSNTAYYGGGAYLYFDTTTTWTNNLVSGNWAGGSGGGIRLEGDESTLRGNTISDNTATEGGGIDVEMSWAELEGNTICSNTADYGGGVFLVYDNETMLVGNTILSNTADYGGGGLCLYGSGVTLQGNQVLANTAGDGGGLEIAGGAPVLIDNVVAGNRSAGAGSGVYVRYAAPRLLHNTVAGNAGGDGHGIFLGGESAALLTNTILVSQTVGITVTAGCTATLAGTLWGGGAWANGADWGGAGIIVTGSVNVRGDPTFLDPAAGDYHIGPGSPAVDAGVDSDVRVDMDGDPRPAGFGYDIGADERPGPSLRLSKSARPAYPNPAQLVTYTLAVTSAGATPAAGAVLVDRLPVEQRAVAISTTWGTCTAGPGWGGAASCDLGTLAPGVQAHITLVAEVTTTLPPILPWPMRNTAAVTATETADHAFADTLLQDCHAQVNSTWPEYTSVQAAVDAAAPGDLVKVAGYCTGVEYGGGITQVVYLSKTLTLRGGYAPGFVEPPDPVAHPTTLDARGEGRVLAIVGAISPTVTGLRLTGGKTGGWEAGGGVYIHDAAGTFSDNRVFGNRAPGGGGLSLENSAATLQGNAVYSNTATYDGGGLYLASSAATLQRNAVYSNTAGSACGGLSLSNSPAVLEANVVEANTAGHGGGLCLEYGVAEVFSNTISANIADYEGGGLFVNGTGTLRSNRIVANTAGEGGGAYLVGDGVVFEGNAVLSNTAGAGGGVYLGGGMFRGNQVAGNRADTEGGGVYLVYGSAWLENNVVANNQAGQSGSGMYVGGAPRLLHNTVAGNVGGDGSGIYLEGGNAALLTNTILVSQTVGITVSAGSAATLAGTLWGSGTWANGADWGGAGTIVTGSVNLWGDPAFLNPAAGDYHIGPGSPAVDAGVDCDVRVDMDGDPRPAGWRYDIGADERPGPSLRLSKSAWPVELSTVQPVTYTLVVTSAGTDPTTGTVLVDRLPVEQRAVAISTTWGTCTAGPGWGGAASCDLGTLAPGVQAHITLVAEVTTTLPPILPWPMRNTAAVTATETANHAAADTFLLRDCHARIDGAPTDYLDVQSAVDAAVPGDLVKIAGYCAGTQDHGGTVQVVYLSKTLTLRGGYSVADDFAEPPDPVAHPTTLDAQGRGGQVLVVVGAISPTIEGLRLTGGSISWGSGGGVSIHDAAGTFSNNWVFGNQGLYGGGLYLANSAATLQGNAVYSNTATYNGGGLYLEGSAATLVENTIRDNLATASHGGGLYLAQSPATLVGNMIWANAATSHGDGQGLAGRADTVISDTAVQYGGGLYLAQSAAILQGNVFYSNTADSGGGLYLWDSPALLWGNAVLSNTALWGYGGGLYLSSSPATLNDNTVAGNWAYSGGGLCLEESPAALAGNRIAANSTARHGMGGGAWLRRSAATLDGNTVAANSASMGGGLFLDHSDATLVNNVVAGNGVDEAGSGVYVWSSAPRLLHNTVAGNAGGDGSGVYVTVWDVPSTVLLTNTILVSQTVGITVAAGCTARLEATLWGNGVDWGGAGTIVTGSVNVWGPPAFLDPAAGDYHLTAGSAAIDAGVAAGVRDDIDGEVRPAGQGYDLGADEFPAIRRLFFLPLVVR